MVNPTFVSTFFTQPTSYDALGNLLEPSGSTTFKFLAEPGRLETTMTNLGSDVVGEYTDIKIDFKVKDVFAADDFFVFETAKWNQGT